MTFLSRVRNLWVSAGIRHYFVIHFFFVASEIPVKGVLSAHFLCLWFCFYEIVLNFLFPTCPGSACKYKNLAKLSLFLFDTNSTKFYVFKLMCHHHNWIGLFTCDFLQKITNFADPYLPTKIWMIARKSDLSILGTSLFNQPIELGDHENWHFFAGCHKWHILLQKNAFKELQ